jgi:hypothetical protein
MKRAPRYLAAAALLALMLAAMVGAGRSAKGYYSYYDMRFKGAGADSVDTLRCYFAKAGSLTAVADSGIGEARVLQLLNLKTTGNVSVRVYHKGGVYDPGTDSAYTLVDLVAQKTDRNATASIWGNPEGLYPTGIRVMTNPGSGGFRWIAGK